MKLPPADCGLFRANLTAIADGESLPEPTLLRRSDGAFLLYPGAVHAISGEPSGGKSWVAQAAVVQVVNAGGRAVILDYEDAPARVVGRLLSLGLEPAALGSVAYLNVSGPIGTTGFSWLEELVCHDGVGLVVIDSVAESLAAEGLSENDSVEVAAWTQKLPRPLARAGAAVLVVDHVAKDAATRGRWPRGSGAKLAAIDGAAYVLQPRVPFTRTSSGIADLVVAKDRHGAIGQVGATVASVAFEVEGGSLARIVLGPPETEGSATSDVAKTHLSVEDVVHRLGSSGGAWSSVADAAQALRVGRDVASALLDAAVATGCVSEDQGPHGARAFRLAPFEPAPSLLDLTEARRRREEP